MTDRREFLAASLGGVGIPALKSASQSSRASSRSAEVESRFFRARFDSDSGKLQAWRADGSPFLSNVVSRVIAGPCALRTSDTLYDRRADTEKVSDHLGTGSRIVARCVDGNRRIDFVVRVTLYDNRDALVVETICRNASPSDLMLRSIEPVRAVPDEDGRCHWPGVTKALTNGYMYYDPGIVSDFDQAHYYSTANGMWNIGFYRGEGEPGLVIGYLENKVADGRISAWDKDGLAVVAESLYNREFVLKPGSSIASGPLIFNIEPDPLTALESYAQAVGEWQQVRLNPVINGWCNWYYTHEFVTEDEIVRNAEFGSRHFKPYGLEYIQVDAGYERAYGDWEGNERFPHGMKWLAGKIRELGLKPGIWVAPYVITEGTEIHLKHPDWLVRDLQGKVKICGGQTEDDLFLIGYGLPSFRKTLYGLDITHPGAAEWMHRLFDTIANDWGYEFIKIDFVEWTLLGAERYHDPGFSKAAAYRRGFEIMRRAIGPRRHLLDCGPAPTTVGLLDSTRIELDYPQLTWDQYVKRGNSNAAAIAKRYYFHNRTWINDADHLGIALLNYTQSCAAASLIALSGGTMILGDRLVELNPWRIEILQKVFPSFGQGCRPVDLFERERPEIFMVPVKKSFAEWTLLGVFNYDDRATAEKNLRLDRLRLDPNDEYVAYEFWSQKLVGVVQNSIRVVLPPASVTLMAIHRKRGVPQVVSTDRHFTQGALELESVDWDSARNRLRGVSIGPPGTQHNVAIYIPKTYVWDQEKPNYFYDFDGYSLKLMEPNILRVHVRFDKSGRLGWEVRFKPRG